MSDNQIAVATEILTVVKSILDERRQVVLPTWDIALLILIWNHLNTEKGLALSISEPEIRHLAFRLDSIEDSKEAQSAEKRCTEAISRLLKSECLSRADMNRLVISDDSEYHITTLGAGVAAWNFEHEKFSGEPLTAILKAFNSYLVKIALDAEQATDRNWHEDIMVQMRVVLNDMLVNVYRHQHGLDQQHEHLRNFIPSLLTEGSEESIKYCEEQLTNVIRTIIDLQEVTLASANTAFQQIRKIEEMGLSNNFSETEETCADIERKLNSVTQWTMQRATEWVEHHNIVHEFLRTVVYIDRQRRVTEALKHEVAAEPQWTFELIEEQSFVKFRESDEQVTTLHTAPRRRKRVYAHDIEEVSIDDLPERLTIILNSEALGDEIYLSRLLKKVLDEGADELDLVYHGPWFMGQIMETGVVDREFRQWTRISNILEIQEMKVLKNGLCKS